MSDQLLAQRTSLQDLEHRWGENWLPENEYGIRTRKWQSPGLSPRNERTDQYEVRWERRNGAYGWGVLYAFSDEEAQAAVQVIYDVLQGWDLPRMRKQPSDILGWGLYRIKYKSGGVTSAPKRTESPINAYGIWSDDSNVACRAEQKAKKSSIYGVKKEEF